MSKIKTDIITFKVDEALAEVLRDIPNRSQFIRAAITSALGVTCPLCAGTGILTPCQKDHWGDFAATHELKRCRKCHEVHLVCNESDGDAVRTSS